MISASCFSIFEVEPPTSRSEQSERVARRGNRHGTTQTSFKKPSDALSTPSKDASNGGNKRSE
jgi:hypothetical protein